MTDDATTAAPADEPGSGKTSSGARFVEVPPCEAGPCLPFAVGQEVWVVHQSSCLREGATLAPMAVRLVSCDYHTATLLFEGAHGNRILFMPLAQVFACRELAMAACWQRCAEVMATGGKARVQG